MFEKVKGFYAREILGISFFSVVLPTYNRAFCITKAINSLYNML